MTFLRHFREHPASVGETYGEHARHAAGFGWSMLRGSLACFIHAAFPQVCTTSGSRAVVRLYDRMVVNRTRLRPDEMSPVDPLACIAEHI